ncbi:MAG: hypothetical protein CMG85_15525 [Marinobacter sp.]|nr:hypothetical protein [Marinobacter sp.]
MLVVILQHSQVTFQELLWVRFRIKTFYHSNKELTQIHRVWRVVDRHTVYFHNQHRLEEDYQA